MKNERKKNVMIGRILASTENVLPIWTLRTWKKFEHVSFGLFLFFTKKKEREKKKEKIARENVSTLRLNQLHRIRNMKYKNKRKRIQCNMYFNLHNWKALERYDEKAIKKKRIKEIQMLI